MKFLQILQVLVAIVLMAAILIQSKGSGLGSVFGGSGGVFTAKRGLDKTLHNATIVIAVLFFAISVAVVIF